MSLVNNDDSRNTEIQEFNDRTSITTAWTTDPLAVADDNVEIKTESEDNAKSNSLFNRDIINGLSDENINDSLDHIIVPQLIDRPIVTDLSSESIINFTKLELEKTMNNLQ